MRGLCARHLLGGLLKKSIRCPSNSTVLQPALEHHCIWPRTQLGSISLGILTFLTSLLLLTPCWHHVDTSEDRYFHSIYWFLSGSGPLRIGTFFQSIDFYQGRGLQGQVFSYNLLIFIRVGASEDRYFHSIYWFLSASGPLRIGIFIQSFDFSQGRGLRA